MGVLLLAFLLIGFSIWVYNLGVLLDNRRRVYRLQPMPWGDGEAPLVSIILPARNEAHQIQACLDSLLAQDYPNWELIAINDRSEDQTGAILSDLATRHPNVTAIEGEELPPGWMGKSWANHQGVARARGAWLLFTDADTCHHPQALSAAMRFCLSRRNALVTLVPRLTCLSFWEKVVQPMILLTSFAYSPLRNLQNPSRTHALAYGAYMLIGRALYDQAGGHAEIRRSVIDDVSLATRVKASGGEVAYTLAPTLLSVRMYRGFRDIWKGYSKNLFAGIKGDWRLGVLALSIWTIASVLPWLAFPAYLVQAFRGAGDGASMLGLGLSGGTLLLNIVIFGVGIRPFCGLSFAWGLAHPLAYCVLASIMANSALRGLTGKGPEWKGRLYPGMHT